MVLLLPLPYLPLSFWGAHTGLHALHLVPESSNLTDCLQPVMGPSLRGMGYECPLGPWHQSDSGIPDATLSASQALPTSAFIFSPIDLGIGPWHGLISLKRSPASICLCAFLSLTPLNPLYLPTCSPLARSPGTTTLCSSLLSFELDPQVWLPCSFVCPSHSVGCMSFAPYTEEKSCSRPASWPCVVSERGWVLPSGSTSTSLGLCPPISSYSILSQA